MLHWKMKKGIEDIMVGIRGVFIINDLLIFLLKRREKLYLYRPNNIKSISL